MMEMNREFKLAEQFVNETNTSIFLTGKAGTGKTTFLRHIVHTTPKKSIVVAPTGVAAIHAKGSTIHSMFGLPLKSFIPVNDPVDHNFTNNPSSLARHFRYRKDKRKLFQELELLIIDEISMVRADLLDAIDLALRYVRRNSEPFGGVQVLAIGDLFQLSPVVRSVEWDNLRAYYDQPYFHSSLAWKNLDAITLELQKVYRQKNDAFLSILNRIRIGATEMEDINKLNKRMISEAKAADLPETIVLTTHNATAKKINRERLLELEGDSYYFKADVSGDFSESAFPVDPEIVLVKGAQVMFVRNDTESGRYFNGKIGRVEVVKKDKITVRCGGQETIDVDKITWENFRYKMDDEGDIEQTKIGSFEQYPLRLAWAITVHKSQGLTFDRMVLDISKSFAPGQVYVALSRCRTLEGLYLKSPLRMQNIMVDRSIVDFYRSGIRNGDLKNVLEHGRKNYLGVRLKKTFHFWKLEDPLNAWLKEVVEKDLDVVHKVESVRLSTELKECVHIARKFYREIDRLLLHYFKRNTRKDVMDRLDQAIAYFSNRLVKNLIDPVMDYYDEIAYVSGAKKHQRNTLEFLNTLWNFVDAMMKSTFDGEPIFTGEILQRPAKLEKSGKQKEARKKESTYDITFSLYKKGMSIKEIAEIRQLTENTVFGHFLKLYRENKVEITQLIDKEKLALLLKHFTDVTTETTLTEIKSTIPFTTTYQDIRAAKAYFLKEN